MKKVINLYLILFTTSLTSCSILSPFNDALEFQMVLGVSIYSLEDFQKSIACYYNQNNKFPSDKDKIINNIDILNTNNNLFSKLELKQTNINSLKCSFKLFPFVAHAKQDSLNSSIDSIRLSEFAGNLIFNDSLIAKNMDSLMVEMQILNIDATVYKNKNSVYYNNESALFSIFLKHPLVYKISIKSSCVK